MKIVLAQMSHETNTFSPVPTPLARFSRRAEVPLERDAARQAYTGTRSCMGAYIDVLNEAGFEFVIPVAGGAPPSGPVEEAAYEYMASRIVEAAKAGCDAMMLDLHGAMVTESCEDGEGELLRRIREVLPDAPIAVALDMHANLFDLIVENSTVIAGYHLYPHLDTYETARIAGRVLVRTLNGEVSPTMVWGNAPMLPHVMRQGTDDFPNEELQARAKELEESGEALAVSLFTGFPHADISNAGLSVVVVTDNDRAKAEAIRDELLDRAWEVRESFVYQIEPLEESVARAKAIGESVAKEPDEGPVIVLDHYDNTASGGTMDTTEVLAEVLKQGLEDIAVFGIFDPEAVDKLIAAGVGSEVTIELGGKTPMPSIPQESHPLEVTGVVKTISNGIFRAMGRARRGATMDIGKCVVLDTGKAEIVVVSRHSEPVDPGCFLGLGIDPEQKRYLMLKSRIHYRAGFKQMAREIVECAGVGVCTSNYADLEFKNVRRPIYPLDGINAPRRQDVEH